MCGKLGVGLIMVMLHLHDFFKSSKIKRTSAFETELNLKKLFNKFYFLKQTVEKKKKTVSIQLQTVLQKRIKVLKCW